VIYTSGDDRYLHLPGLIVAENATGDVRYLMPDGLGSIRQAVDSQGQVAVYHEFDPYGSPVENGGDPYGFTGEWWEEEVALLHLRARWYAPGVGVFLSRDQWPGTVLHPQSMNGWNYVEGNPVNV
jgi:RHS repeat-associated protein